MEDKKLGGIVKLYATQFSIGVKAKIPVQIIPNDKNTRAMKLSERRALIFASFIN